MRPNVIVAGTFTSDFRVHKGNEIHEAVIIAGIWYSVRPVIVVLGEIDLIDISVEHIFEEFAELGVTAKSVAGASIGKAAPA